MVQYRRSNSTNEEWNLAKSHRQGQESGKDNAGRAPVVSHLKPTGEEQSAVAANPSVDAANHPYKNVFLNRVDEVFARVDGSADFDGEALWTNLVESIHASMPFLDATPLNERNRLIMDSPEFTDAIAEFGDVISSLTEASESQFANARSFGFWSGRPGRQLAESCCDLTLETSNVGAVFDDLVSINAFKLGWDPQLWGALSQGYASAVRENLRNSPEKEVRVCVGPYKEQEGLSNIWATIESEALDLTGEEFGTAMEERVTYYAAFIQPGKKDETDTSFTEGGVAGAGYAVSSWEEAAKRATAHADSVAPDSTPAGTAVPNTGE